MKPHHFILCAIALLPISFSLVSMIESAPAKASQQTDRQWKQYLGGRKIIHFSNYSSSFGGGGMSSQLEIHFCSNGQFAYASESSVSMAASDASGNSGGRERHAGNWKIVESNPGAVLIEFVSDRGETQQSIFNVGRDGNLYNGGKKFLGAASGSCR